MDTINKALILDSQVQAIAIKSTDIVNEAIRLHELSPVCAAALGRTLSAAAMTASNLKGKDDSLSVTVKGGGPAGAIVAACDSKLNIRGYVDNPFIDLPLKPSGKLDVGGAVGKNGKLTVIKDIGLKNAYIGQTELVSGEIAEDFTKYFAVSEQQPCMAALGVLIGRDYKCLSAGGLILNILPNCSEEAVKTVEKLSEKFKDISAGMKDISAKEFLYDYFKGYGIEFTQEQYPVYKCKCAKDTIDRVVISLSKEQALDIADKEGKISVKCHFCNREYIYSREDILKLF